MSRAGYSEKGVFTIGPIHKTGVIHGLSEISRSGSNGGRERCGLATSEHKDKVRDPKIIKNLIIQPNPTPGVPIRYFLE